MSSFIYASSLYAAAAAAATRCAFDYLTGCGGAPVARMRELGSMSDDELWSAIDEAEADGWRIASSDDQGDQYGEWDASDVSIERIRALLAYQLDG